MAATRKHPHDTAQTPQDVALAEVASTQDALRRTRRAQAPLADIRATFCEAADALDAALVQATASGGRPLVRQLRMARDLLILERRDTNGVDVPDCAQTTSLDADGPHAFGLEFERIDPHGPHTPHMHGLDLTAALDPATRADAGHRGPYANHRRQPAARWVEPAAKVKASVISAGATASTGQA